MADTRLKTLNFVYYYRRVMKDKHRIRAIIKDNSDVIELLDLIYDTIADHYVNNQGGVYIENIGYLCHVIRPKRSFGINRLIGNIYREKTGGYKYKHIALDFSKNKKFFHLDIQESLNKRLVRYMNEGKRYKFLYREVCGKVYKKRDVRVHKIYKKGELKCLLKN